MESLAEYVTTVSIPEEDEVSREVVVSGTTELDDLASVSREIKHSPDNGLQ
jgi:hypothetical protein